MPQEIYVLSCEDAVEFVCDAKWPFAIINAECEFVWLNHAYCEVLNAPQELILGTKFQTWTHKNDVDIDSRLAERVASGELPGYTLSKRYIRRGSTPSHPLIVWGLLSVVGKWDKTTGRVVGYLVQFRQYEAGMAIDPQRVWSVATTVVKWSVMNWKAVLAGVAIATYLIWGNSAKLLDALHKAIEVKRSVDSALDSLSPGPSLPPD